MPKPSMIPLPSSASPSSSNEVVAPPAKRRSFSPAEKLRILRQADACSERGEVEALLRREGIYSSHLSAWRKALGRYGSDGLSARKPGRKPKRDAKDLRIEVLEKKSARLERELSLARKLIELQKKVSEILGIQLPTDEG